MNEESVSGFRVAILVLNHNGRRFLSGCFSSLKDQVYKNFEVYLIDNCSSDNSIEYTERNFPFVKIIRFDNNLGFAKAYNEAIKLVKADFAVFLNNDTMVDKFWLAELMKPVMSDKMIAAVGSKLLLMDQPNLLHNAGSKITPIGSGFDIGFREENSQQYNFKKEVGAVCGGSMLVPKDVFLKIGGFDEDFFAYFEDVDYCWRAWIFGYKIIYAPSSVVLHKVGGSFRSDSLEKSFLFERNRLFTVLKNFELKGLFLALILSIPYNVAKIFPNNQIASGSLFVTNLRANLYVLQHLNRVLRKRKLIASCRVVSDKMLYQHNIISSVGEGLHEFFKSFS